MGPADEHLPFDAAFDAAFADLARCRAAYEDDPRDPGAYRRLADARAALDDARRRMNAERERLGLRPRRIAGRSRSGVDEPVRHEWQTIQGEG